MPIAPTSSSNPTCGPDCETEFPTCVWFHGADDGCDVCLQELQESGSTLVNRGNCVVGCTLTDAMLAVCNGMPTPGLWFNAPWIFYISWILVFGSIVCSVGSWIFVFCYRKKPIVKIGQPEFLYSLCFGSLLISIGLVFLLAVSFFDAKNETTSHPVDSKTGIIFNVCCNMWGWFW